MRSGGPGGGGDARGSVSSVNKVLSTRRDNARRRRLSLSSSRPAPSPPPPGDAVSVPGSNKVCGSVGSNRSPYARIPQYYDALLGFTTSAADRLVSYLIRQCKYNIMSN